MLKVHKYSIGQNVRYTSGPFGRFGASGSFKIVKLLPPEGDEHQYRIKSTGEAFERVAKESQLDRERPDLVSICLPNEEHFPLTLQVIQAGFPLFVEKPLVFDLAEADDLLARAQANGLFFAINFNHRYAEPIRRAKAA